LTDRIRVRPFTAGERLVDEDHAGRVDGIVGLEEASLQQRDANHFEIVLVDALVLRQRRVLGRRPGTAGDQEAQPPRRVEREEVGEARI